MLNSKQLLGLGIFILDRDFVVGPKAFLAATRLVRNHGVPSRKKLNKAKADASRLNLLPDQNHD